MRLLQDAHELPRLRALLDAAIDSDLARSARCLSTLPSLCHLGVSRAGCYFYKYRLSQKVYENNDQQTNALPTDWRAASVRTLVAACALVVSFVILMVAVVSKSRGTITALWSVLTLPILYTLFYGNGATNAVTLHINYSRHAPNAHVPRRQQQSKYQSRMDYLHARHHKHMQSGTAASSHTTYFAQYLVIT